MKVRAAALLSAPGKYETIEVELEGPRQNEVLVRVAAAGLCHSDDHIATGDLPVGKYPVVGGHEGAGVVEEVGPGVKGVAVGDEVIGYTNNRGSDTLAQRGLNLRGPTTRQSGLRFHPRTPLLDRN